MTWESSLTTRACPGGTTNLNVFKTENGELVKALVQKKQSRWYVLMVSCCNEFFCRVDVLTLGAKFLQRDKYGQTFSRQTIFRQFAKFEREVGSD